MCPFYVLIPTLTLLQPRVTRTFPNKFVDLNEPWMVMEWSPHETLAEQKDVSASEMKTLLEQVLDGAAYVHGQDMVHRDIQPSNIFVVSRMPMTCKLGGISPSTSRRYQAPEVVVRGSYLSTDCSVDIWSIGVLTLQYTLFNHWVVPMSKWSGRQHI